MIKLQILNPAYAGTASSGVRTLAAALKAEAQLKNDGLKICRLGVETPVATVSHTAGLASGPQDSITHPLAIPKWLGRIE